MAATIRLEGRWVDGGIEYHDGGLSAALARLFAFGEDQTEAMDDVGLYLERVTDQRFRDEAGPGGVPWVEVTRATRRRKRHPKILTESGQLRSRFAYQASPNELVFGTNVPYAGVHQFGGTIERAAYSIVQRLRVDAKGQLLRQEHHANLAVYAKARHKRAVERRATIEAYSIKMPVRPMLGFDDADEREITRIFAEHVERAASR